MGKKACSGQCCYPGICGTESFICAGQWLAGGGYA